MLAAAVLLLLFVLIVLVNARRDVMLIPLVKHCHKFDMLLHGHDARVLNTLHPTRNPNLWPRGCIMQLAKAPELSASENMSAKMARFAPWQGRQRSIRNLAMRNRKNLESKLSIALTTYPSGFLVVMPSSPSPSFSSP